MVWKEYMDEVLQGLGATSPIPGLTRRSVFRALTEARHELQMETGLCHKKMDVNLSTAMDANGLITIGGLVHMIDRAELILDQTHSQVAVINPDAFEAFVRAGQLTHSLEFPRTPICPSPIAVITISDEGLELYPYQGFETYTLRLRYQPRLNPYAKSETEQYPGYDTDFKTKIEEEGPEPVFDTAGAQRGIIGRAKILLFERVPDLDQALAAKLPIWLRDWENAKNLMEKSNPSMASNSNTMAYFVPVP